MGVNETDASKEEAAALEAIINQQEPYVVEAAKKAKAVFPVWVRVCIITVAVLAVLYFGGVWFFATHFSWHSTLNGIDVSFMSNQKAKDTVQDAFQSYELAIDERDDNTEYIQAEEIELQFQLLDTDEDFLKQQNYWNWFIYGFEVHEYSLKADVSFNRRLLNETIEKLNCMQSEQITYPVEPQIVKKSGEYAAEEGITGNQLKSPVVRKVVTDAIKNLNKSVNLEKEQCYVELKYNKEDKQVQTAVDYLNAIQDMRITYQLDDETEVLKGSQIIEWVEISEDYEVTFNQTAMAEYIEYLKENYEIKGQTVNFDTSYGSTVQITSYIQSTAIDTDAEVLHLSEAIRDAYESGQKKFIRTSEDMVSIGDTYIEINLTSQQLYCYKDGEMILHTDVVTGKPSTGCATPPGVYTIRSKSSPAVLVGDTYRTPVSYWMPFNGGIGLHDATWQSSFGGSRYITNGSHGCVNLRLDVAKFIYEQYSAGDIVVLYHLEGTETQEATPAGTTVSSSVPVHTDATTEVTTEGTTASTTEVTTTETTEVTTTEATTEVTTASTTEVTTETTTESINKGISQWEDSSVYERKDGNIWQLMLSYRYLKALWTCFFT
jgi:hypothetical protein